MKSMINFLKGMIGGEKKKLKKKNKKKLQNCNEKNEKYLNNDNNKQSKNIIKTSEIIKTTNENNSCLYPNLQKEMAIKFDSEQNKYSSDDDDFEECLAPNESMDVDFSDMTSKNFENKKTNETIINFFDTTVDSNKTMPVNNSEFSNNKNLTSLINLFENFSVNEAAPNNEFTALKPILPEYNILLLGGTGTGKSTTINAYANYVKFNTIEKAQEQTFVELIPSSFKLAHPDLDEEFCIETGTDLNESTVIGGSRTQGPMAYRFNFSDKIIRLIDTPGMGDTRGLKVDKENFEKILEYLKNYKTLHGIVILIKSNETRNVTAFRYCITELFSRLHRSASENVFFCFTYSRNTFFRAGDGLHMLNNLLNEEFPEAKLILKPKINCFFIDNEAYRFLVAKKAGYPYEDDEIETYNEAWNKSAAQTEQMLSFIIKKNPHNLQSTFKLNMAQNFIAELADPIVQLQKNIYLNICKIERQREIIESGFTTVDNMLNTMHMTVYDLECVKLDSPNTVCASKKCKEINMIDGVKKGNFKKCCINCPEKYVPLNKKKNRVLLDCKIFNQNGKFSYDCYNCGCSWEEHMHCQTDYKPVPKKVIDPEKEKELNELLKTNENKENVLNKIIKTLNDTSEEYKSEIDTIQKVAACFGYLLNKHSNSSVNQFIEPHLDLLIEEEQKKIISLSNYSNDLYNMLIGLKECHSNYVKEIEFAAENGLQLELENIDTIADELQNLKHFGKMFTKLIEKFLKDNVKTQKYDEKIGYSV